MPTSLDAKERTVIIAPSPDLQRRETDKGEYDGDDPEPDHNRGLAPAELLVVVVDRCHLEHALAGQAKRYDLDNHRDRLEDKKTADNGENDLVLYCDGDGAQRTAERQRSRVAHEDHRGRRVVPEKAQPGTDEGGKEHGALADMGDVVELKVVRELAVADEVGDQDERRGGDHHRHDRKPVEPVREVDRVGRPRNHKSADYNEEK